MLISFWFSTSKGIGYGVTAESHQAALALLQQYGYPEPGTDITGVVQDIKFVDLDHQHVVPNAGPMIIRGVWFPRHNV